MITELAQRYDYIAKIYNTLDENRNDGKGADMDRFSRACVEMDTLDKAILLCKPEDDADMFVLAATLNNHIASLIEDLVDDKSVGFQVQSEIVSATVGLQSLVEYLLEKRLDQYFPNLADYKGATFESLVRCGIDIGPHDDLQNVTQLAA